MTEILLVASAVAAGCFSTAAYALHWSLRRAQRDWSRREQVYIRTIGELTDRVMHMSGRTWTPPPELKTGEVSPDLYEDLVLYPEQAALIEEPG